MKNSNALKIIAASACMYCHSALFAHDGHGMAGTHWYTTDSWGFVLVVTVAVWVIAGQPGARK